jgi:hypothetical protein
LCLFSFQKSEKNVLLKDNKKPKYKLHHKMNRVAIAALVVVLLAVLVAYFNFAPPDYDVLLYIELNKSAANWNLQEHPNTESR